MRRTNFRIGGGQFFGGKAPSESFVQESNRYPNSTINAFKNLGDAFKIKEKFGCVTIGPRRNYGIVQGKALNDKHYLLVRRIEIDPAD